MIFEEARDMFETGVPSIDARLTRFVEAARARYEARLRAVYLTGSWREGTAVAGSDLDVVVVLQGLASQEDAAALLALADSFDEEHGPPLGPMGLDDEELAQPLPKYLKHAALLWGEDVFSDLPEMSALATHRRWTLGALRLFALLRRPREDASTWSGYTLGSPDTPGLKLVVSTVARVAGARAARRGMTLPSKSACCLRYRELVGDEDADTVEQIYQTLKVAWEYGWPPTQEEEARLGDLCQRVTALERRFFAEVATWIEEASDDVAWAERCARYVSPDAQVSKTWGDVALWHDRGTQRWWLTSERGVEPLRMFVRERGGFDVLVNLREESQYHLGWDGRLERLSDGRVWAPESA